MVDIVEWLRNSKSEEWCGAMLDKAADEIELLRDKLSDKIDAAHRAALEKDNK